MLSLVAIPVADIGAGWAMSKAKVKPKRPPNEIKKKEFRGRTLSEAKYNYQEWLGVNKGRVSVVREAEPKLLNVGQSPRPGHPLKTPDQYSIMVEYRQVRR